MLYYLRQFSPIFWALLSLILLSFYYVPDLVTLFSCVFLISYMFSPVVKWLEKKGLNRAVSSMFVTLLILQLIAIILLFIIPIVHSEIVLLAKAIPRYLAGVKAFLNRLVGQYGGLLDKETINEQINRQFADIVGVIPSLITRMLSSSLAIASIITSILVVPVSIFFLLRDWKIMTVSFKSLFHNSNNNEDNHISQMAEGLIKELDQALMFYVRRQAILCLFMAIFYTIFLSLAGLRHGFAIGILTGFFLFIPYIGNLVSFGLCMVLAVSQFDSMFNVFSIVLIFFVGQLLENLYLVPAFVGKSIGVHPVWILFALLLTSKIMGVSGIILTMPALAIIAASIRFYNKQVSDSL